MRLVLCVVTAGCFSRQRSSLGAIWMLPGNLPHIGIVTAEESPAGTPLMVHNIGRGPEIEDILFRFLITGHYRYRGL